MILGRVDKIHSHAIFGWAMDDERPEEHVAIEVVADDVVVAQGIAEKHRPDLKSAGFGDGDHAFEIEIPADLKASDLRVQARSSLATSPLEVADAEEHKFSELYDILVARYDALFASMVQRSQTYERLFNESLNKTFDERRREVDEKLADFNDRLETAEVSLLRIDEMVRRLVQESARKKRKRFFGLF